MLSHRVLAIPVDFLQVHFLTFMIFSLKAAMSFAVVLLSLEYKRHQVLVVVSTHPTNPSPISTCAYSSCSITLSLKMIPTFIIVKAVIMSLCEDPATTTNDHLDQLQEYTVSLCMLGYSYD